jgi:CubicO group peptidase (beta-lactamase class C family)
MRRRDFLQTGIPAGLGSLLLLRPGRGWTAETIARVPADRSFNDAVIAKIERRMPGLMRETKVPGAAIAVVSNGRIAWQRAFGTKDAASREPVDENTVFESASVSKTVFAYLALKLCERGTLELDTPLTRYTKKRFFDGDPRLDRVTARHALAHTTGFPDWRSGSPPLAFNSDPGARFHYSGEGYYYLQSVVTEVAGRTFSSPCGRYEAGFEVCATDFDEFMRRSLLGPLGMNTSGYVWCEHFERHAARPHDIRGQPLARKKPNAADVARYGAAGELRTTVGEYAKFLLAVLSPPAGDSFLGAELRNEMLRPQVKLDPAEKIDGADSWALGWAVQERPTGHVILHSGGQSGFRSLTMASVERKSGFVIFTNSDNGGHVCYDRQLGESLTPLLAG